jgi:acetyl esterase
MGASGPNCSSRAKEEAMTDLHGKVALITGSVGGIGKAIAERCASLSANIVVNYSSYGRNAHETVASRAGRRCQISKQSDSAIHDFADGGRYAKVKDTRRRSMKNSRKLVTLILSATIWLAHMTSAQSPNPTTDPRINPQVRVLLGELNKNTSPFWELPQPKPQEILTGLQNETPVDMSGVTTVEKTITEDGRTVKLYIMTPMRTAANPGVLLFIHGGVWIVGNFQNHQRLLRDLVVGSGQIGVFVEYTPLPEAKYPTQLDECYTALKWVSAHAAEIGADGTRIAVAGNSVGGNMTAALALMAKDKNGPKIAYQVLLIPATDASVDTASYHEFGTGRFLARSFMKYGWDLYAPDEKTRNSPYVSPLRASQDELKGLPPALVITAENDPLRDEGEAYARKLMDAGVLVAATRYDGMIHDFVLLNAIRDTPPVKAALQQANDGIREALSR